MPYMAYLEYSLGASSRAGMGLLDDGTPASHVRNPGEYFQVISGNLAVAKASLELIDEFLAAHVLTTCVAKH